MEIAVKISIDSLCLCIFGLVFLYVLLGRKKKTELSKTFLQIVIFSILMILGDLINWVNSGKEGMDKHIFVWIGLLLYYCSSGFLVNSLIIYIKSIVGKHREVAKIFTRLGLIIAVVSLLISVSSVFTKQIFYVNEANEYVRGPLYLLTQFPVIMYAIVVIMLCVYRGCLTTKERIFIFLYTILPIAGELVQLIIPGTTFFVPGMTIALMMLYIYVQNERTLQDKEAEKNEIDIRSKEIEAKCDNREKQLYDAMETIVNISEKRELCTNGHAKRVGNYTREIAHRMGMDEEYQIEAYYAGLFHDIGMLDIPEEIINKPTELTADEWEILKTHTTSGYHTAKIMKEYSLIRDAARWHHERLDGKGYPNRLRGENIPLIARIVAVADAYDSMTSDRPYRKKLERHKVYEELKSNAGSQFDSSVVDIILKMMFEDTGFEMQEMTSNYEQSILVVDDDVVIHDLVENAMKDESYSITCALSVEDALHLLELEDFSLCLIDIKMPEKDGFELMQKINATNKKTKVIFMTSTKDIESIRKVEEMGAKDYITKPFSFSVLRKSVKMVLNSK